MNYLDFVHFLARLSRLFAPEHSAIGRTSRFISKEGVKKNPFLGNKRPRTQIARGIQAKHVQSRVKQIFQGLIRLLYPSLCLHCQERLSNREPLFCSFCFEHISLLEIKGRCPICFTELLAGPCEKCIHRKVVVNAQITACENQGPIKSLIREMTQGRKNCIAAAAALMAYQWTQSQRLLPQVLIPLPTTFSQRQKAGFDIQHTLAQEIGKIFNVPTLASLKAKFDRHRFLAEGSFSYCIKAEALKNGNIADHRILLIALKQEDERFREAATELKFFFPAQIEALSLIT